MIKRILVLFQLILTLASAASSQDVNAYIDNLIDSIEEYNSEYYENIYAHTNKEIYQPGESFWFKAYVTGVSNSASTSSTLYVQLFDSLKNLIHVKRYKIEQGISAGTFETKSDLNAGAYYLVFSTLKSKKTKNSFIKPLAINNFNSPRNIRFDNFDKPITPQNLAIESKNDSLIINYQTTSDPFYSIILQVNGELLWASSFIGTRKISIPHIILPKGVATIFCFDRNNQLLESLSHPIKLNDITGVFSEEEVDIVENQVTHKVTLTDKNGNPLRGNLSAAVYIKELNPYRNEKTDIASYSYNRNEIYLNLTGDNLESESVEDKYIISGKVESRPRKIENIKVTAVDINAGKFYESEIEDNGIFSIEIDSTDYDSEFVVGANYKGKPMDIVLYDTVKYSFFPPQFNYQTSKEPILADENDNSEKQLNEIKDYLDHLVLPEIVVSSSRVTTEKKDTVNNTKLFSYFNNVKVEEITKDRINVVGGDDLLSLLRNYTTFALVKELPNSREVYFSKSFISLLYPPPVLFVVNGYPRGTNLLLLNDINLNYIKSVRIIKNLSAVIQFGSEAAGGVILIDTEDFITDIQLTYNDNIESKVEITSYYSENEPFTPSGNLESCIFWEDNIIPNEKGDFTLSFKKPDIKGTLILKIEGIDSNSTFVSFEKELNLQGL
ncbi:TonB-dependent receptor [Fulvivirga lutea]|uniref:TonB-dependent receptor plug domain-containing protein n=1 Tax=Fulvivirga lutea TaxID=2810512 RepID=A0A974WIN5_9BACT|nr:TonB-dependent receptor plug domain-containing protein [Fulvivirga lutea]QSE98880.1 TonB-dependent receptor plug domain-containing protein [Fulvivirga lutea]